MNANTEREILGVLKDMSLYLSKQDATQEKAKISKPPKTGDDQKPIVGGQNGPFGPGAGIAQKEFVEIPKTSPIAGTENPGDGKDATLLKHDEECAEGEEHESMESPEEEAREDEGGDEGDVEEIKSLLKSIVGLLQKSEKPAPDYREFIRKEVKRESDTMLRKMGFHPSTPDIVRFDPAGNRLGIDQTADIKKSEDGKASGDEMADKQAEALKIVNAQTKKSWRELGAEREALGGFNPFQK